VRYCDTCERRVYIKALDGKKCNPQNRCKIPENAECFTFLDDRNLELQTLEQERLQEMVYAKLAKDKAARTAAAKTAAAKTGEKTVEMRKTGSQTVGRSEGGKQG
jgi:hypothetical protein